MKGFRRRQTPDEPVPTWWSDMGAREALRPIGQNPCVRVNDLHDEQARGAIAYAALVAGMTFQQRRLPSAARHEPAR